jgi:hypothetical protein
MSHNRHSSVSHTRVSPPYSESMESTRPTWSDHRMDDFAERTERSFREVKAGLHATRTEFHDEIKDVKTEVKSDIQALRVEMNGRFAGIERRFDILFGALATGLIGAVVSHFLG